MSCLAFATSTAHEHHVSPPEHLSVEYLFFHSVTRSPGQNATRGITMSAAAAALGNDGQPLEAAWPYSAHQPTPWTPPAIGGTLHKATMLLGVLGFDGIVGALDSGSPVILGLVITDAFLQPDVAGLIADKTPDTERGGHAVLAVGHGNDPALGNALLIRNSWGASWGLGGYAWLPRAYVARQLRATATLS